MSEKVYYPANGKSCFVNGIRVDVRGYVPSIIEEKGFEAALRMNILTLLKPQINNAQKETKLPAPDANITAAMKEAIQETEKTLVEENKQDKVSKRLTYKEKLAKLKEAGHEYKGFPASEVVDKDYDDLQINKCPIL